jgi:uncharacterized membrane protein
MMAGTSEARGRLLYWIMAAVSLVGLGDSIYLTVQHLTGETLRCTLIAGCSEVLGSSYAVIAGMPLAVIGAAAYFTVFSLAILAAFSYRLAGSLLMALVGVMFLMTLWLTFVQAFVIRHFCQFCLLSALTTLILTGLVIARWRQNASQVAT